ncbi:MAG: hypothetical protein EBX30_15445, partial [Betaproteobacteria bacterium]|nr:hypothetical protein [Betaproteobacteria bacterium]
YATITEVFATIGDKQLKGVVKANKEAERDYEKALSRRHCYRQSRYGFAPRSR